MKNAKKTIWIMVLALPLVFLGYLLGTSSNKAAETFQVFAEPNKQHFLGTTFDGKDFLSSFASAALWSFSVALFICLLTLIFSLLLGFIQGTSKSKWITTFMLWTLLGFMTLPDIVMIMQITSGILEYDVVTRVSLILLISILSMPKALKLIADRSRSLQKKLFITALQDMGASRTQLFFRGYLPHLLLDVAWLVALLMPRLLQIEMGLSYLGISYFDFVGLGKLTATTFDSLHMPTAQYQMVFLVFSISAICLFPQWILRNLNRVITFFEKKESRSFTTV